MNERVYDAIHDTCGVEVNYYQESQDVETLCPCTYLFNYSKLSKYLKSHLPTIKPKAIAMHINIRFLALKSLFSFPFSLLLMLFFFFLLSSFLMKCSSSMI